MQTTYSPKHRMLHNDARRFPDRAPRSQQDKQKSIAFSETLLERNDDYLFHSCTRTPADSQYPPGFRHQRMMSRRLTIMCSDREQSVHELNGGRLVPLPAWTRHTRHGLAAQNVSA